ncbi:MAG TPA: phage terminase large subunit [Steroidobacteraceae bacterium]|nr:phage terminase large subunit [Steroidobacteraceae bacterium]
MNQAISRADLERFAAIAAEKRRRLAKADQCSRGYRDEAGVWQGGLLAFVRYFWAVLEPGTPFVDGWPLEAICQHLESVTFGEITKLLINVPPGFMKSLLTDVFWPAWEWGPMELQHLRYVAFSYSSSLTERDNLKFKELITSRDYQAMYPHVAVRKTGEKKVSNGAHGWKLASSVGGVGTGERGDRIILDDPHNVKESESEAVRKETIRWFRESMSSRLNNMKTGAKVVIMQRVNEEDVSGTIITEMDDWCHLLIQMEYVWGFVSDERGECVPPRTEIGWTDPRWRETPEECDGELAWEERFPAEIIPSMKSEAGPYAWAGQYQQTPRVRGSAIFELDWWQPWEPADGKFPPFSYVLCSVDSAYTEKEENDPSAMGVLGIFENEQGHNRVMLMHAWRRRLRFSGPKVIPEPGEKMFNLRKRQEKAWGLCEWVADTCIKFKADRLLIEAKASGISAAQSLQNSHPNAGWGIQLVDPKGDKYARALAVQPSFSQGMVYVPYPLRVWGEKVTEEMAVFPKGKFKDLTDAMTQGIKHLRDAGLLRTDEDLRAEDLEKGKLKPKQKPLYPGVRRG